MNKFKIGLIAEIDNSSDNSSAPVKWEDWRIMLDYFSNKGDAIIFDWKDLDNNLIVSRWVKGVRGKAHLIEEKTSINDLVDIVYIGQLGEIYKNKKNFLDFLGSLEKFKGQVINSVPIMKNNLSKQYLLDLQKDGISVVPTLDVDNSYSISDLKNLEFPNYGKQIDGIVLKPKVFGEQGNDVVKLEDFPTEEKLQEYFSNSGEVIAQPLIREIFKKGENQIIFVGGKVSHAINKFTGTFKVNFCETRKYAKHIPTLEELELCNKAFSTLNVTPNYARVDIIPSDKPLISEIEMLNPSCSIERIEGFYEIFLNNLNRELNEVHINNGR